MPDPLPTRILRAAELLVSLYGDDLTHLLAKTRAGGLTEPVPLVAPAPPPAAAGASGPPQPRGELAAMCAKILGVYRTAAAPLSAAVCADRLGCSAESGHFKSAMSKLKKEGELIQPDPNIYDYWLASRPLPSD